MNQRQLLIDRLKARAMRREQKRNQHRQYVTSKLRPLPTTPVRRSSRIKMNKIQNILDKIRQQNIQARNKNKVSNQIKKRTYKNLRY